MSLDSGGGQALRIGIAQIFALDGDRAGNFVRIENAVAEAKAMGAEIVTLPESCILGWENPAAHERAYGIPGADSHRLCELARQHQVYLCVGLDEKDGDRLFGSCILVSDRGQLLLKHRKVNVLPELMTPPYSAGSGASVVETRFGRIGILICADSFVEELLQETRKASPDILLVPYGWAAPEEKWPEHGKNLRDTVLAVAAEVGCAVVGTDLVGTITNGPWSGQVYGGQSVVAEASGKVLHICRDRDRDVVVVTVPAGRRLGWGPDRPRTPTLPVD
jgi:predicted amidohydrolase